MNYNDFLTRQQQIKKLSIAEQKNFYEQLLKKKIRQNRSAHTCKFLLWAAILSGRKFQKNHRDYRTNHSGLSKLSVYP